MGSGENEFKMVKMTLSHAWDCVRMSWKREKRRYLTREFLWEWAQNSKNLIFSRVRSCENERWIEINRFSHSVTPPPFHSFLEVHAWILGPPAQTTGAFGHLHRIWGFEKNAPWCIWAFGRTARILKIFGKMLQVWAPPVKIVIFRPRSALLS